MRAQGEGDAMRSRWLFLADWALALGAVLLLGILPGVVNVVCGGPWAP